jgi:NAD(P)-dependent dehydrogenase (short-subunit alcohol dehydrogenase family)
MLRGHATEEQPMAMDRMKDKVAIVTGAAPRGDGLGNGMACAMMFAQEGAKVVLVNRKREKADALADKIRSEGGEAHVITCDVTQEDQVEAMVAETMDKYGRVDVLHNNAGIGGGGPLEQTELSSWQKVVGLNMTGVMLCCKAAVPAMRAGGRGGSIINISSIAGATGLLRDSGGAMAYTATKAGLHGITMSIAADYAKEQIRCNTLVVGSVYTPMVAHQGEEARQRRAKMVPLMTEGTAWDVAYAATFLASEESRWITGIELPVDGGLLATRQWPA